MQATSSCEAQTDTSLERNIAALRAVGDAEGVGKLLLDGTGTKDERRALRLRPDEVQVLKRLKKARRVEKPYKVAEDYLGQLRNENNIYRVAYLVSRPEGVYRDLVTGENLPSGVDRYELSETETAAVRRRAELRLDRQGLPIEWKCLRRGHYQSTNGLWTIRNWGFNEWWVYLDGEPVGGWSDRPYWPYGRHYVPFGTAWEAKLYAEEYEPPLQAA